MNVEFQPIGYTFGRLQEGHSLYTIDSQVDLESITQALDVGVACPEVDFSKKKVVVVRSTVSFPHVWLIVWKVELTASSVLQVLCQNGNPRSAMASIAGPVTMTQFLTIDKEVVYDSQRMGIDPVPAVIAPELDEIEQQRMEIDQKEFDFALEASKSGFANFYYKCQLEGVNPDDITDPEKKEFATEYAKVRSEQLRLHPLFEELKEEVSNKLRGPYLRE